MIPEYFESHLVLKEYRRVLALVQWVYAYAYMIWFYMVSYHIMTRDNPGRPPKLTNYEVREAQDDHTEDVTTLCLYVWEMGRASIKDGLFEDGSS